MNELATKILAAHVIATKAMEDAITNYRAELEKNPAALAQAKRVCGNAPIEPLYCGFAWVIIPAELNPGFAKAAKEAYASFGFKLDAAGNVLTAAGEFARGDVPAHVRDLGAPAGYTRKGECKKNDWMFHGPGSYRGQSMDIKEIGAMAFRDALEADGTVVGARVRTRGD